MNIINLEKSEIRYVLYRKRNSLLDQGVVFEETKLNCEIVSFIESQPEFKKLGGWLEFAMKWDVVPDEEIGWRVSKRRTSETKEWDAVLQYRADIFPTLTGGKYDKIIK